MDVLIQKLNGETKKFSELFDAIVQDILISSTDIREYDAEIQGRPGKISKGADHGPKTVTVPFIMRAYDLMDYPFKRDEMYYWLGGVEPFYIYEGRSLGETYKFQKPGEPDVDPHATDNDFIYGKRYLVRRSGGFAPDQRNTWGMTTISFTTYELPFGETAATTLTPFLIGTSGDPMQDSIWTVGHAEIFDEAPQYRFAGNGTYRVYNGGTETVDPDEGMYLKITYKGASNGLTLVNQTNGTRWKYNGTSTAAQTIVIEGIGAKKGVQSIVGETELNLLTFAPGWNTIVVSGGGGELELDFRWYFR